jgi:hypothetical protein
MPRRVVSRSTPAASSRRRAVANIVDLMEGWPAGFAEEAMKAASADPR